MTNFTGAFIKTLGDGAMVIQERPIPQSYEDVSAIITDILLKICRVEADFRAACELFTIQHGHTTSLKLGWGVTRGIVNVLSKQDIGVVDYVGSNINKCARLCYIARPAGIVIDREDFPMLPQLPSECTLLTEGAQTFQAEDHQVNGIVEPIPVWTLLSSETQREKG